MRSPVEQIKEKLSIVDVISSYLSVQESGKNYKARCPFHNEKTPSFFISPDRGTYYCFGCGAKGDIFSFVQQFEGIDFLGSLKLLAERAGVPLEFHKKGEAHDQMERLYDIMEEATNFFESVFASQPEARAYVRTRGVSDSTIQSFRIGYAPSAWRSVSDHLLSKGFKKEDIEAVGLIKKSETGFYDRFRARIMFPISDSSGRIIAFSGRTFSISTDQPHKSDVTDAKYLNSPDTVLFNKSHVLYGIDKAKAAIRSRDYSIIVEGQMDLILSHQALFANTVAVSGTALADDIIDSQSKINNLGLVRRLSENVIFAFDGDEAGIRAASRAAMIALSLDMQVKVAVLPEGQDPADIISSDPSLWKDSIKNSLNIVSFHIDRICKSTPDVRMRGKKIRDSIFPFLSMVKSSIERSAYIHELHTKTGLSEGAMIEDFALYEKVNSRNTLQRPNVETKVPTLSRRDNLERRLFGIIFWQEPGGGGDILYADFKKRIGEQVFEDIRQIYEPVRDALAFEAEMWYGSKIDACTRDTTEIILNLEEEILHEQKMLLQPLDSEEKLTQFTILSKRIEEIKQSRGL